MDTDHPRWTTTSETRNRNIPSAILLQNGFVLLPLWGSFFLGIDHPQWATTPKTHCRTHSICHLTAKRLGSFAALGVILDGYRPPSMDDYPREPTIANIPSATLLQNGFILLPLLGAFWTDIRHPQWPTAPENPPSQTFHVPFLFKMASYFCRLWGSIWMDIDHTQWATTPETHNRNIRRGGLQAQKGDGAQRDHPL